MFSNLFFDLLSFLGVLIVCTLIAVVGIILTMVVGGVITAVIKSFRKTDKENDNGSDT